MSSKKRKLTAKDRSVSAKKPRKLKPSKTTTVVVPRGPVAPRTIVKLKYQQDWASNGTTIDQVFNLNSIFDPDRTGGGHQPLGRDQWVTFYNRYRVISTKYIIRSVGVSADSVWKVNVLASNDGATFTNVQLAGESPDATTKLVTNSSPAVFHGSFYMPRLNGQTTAQYMADDRFQALMSADPSEVLCLHIVHSAVGTDATPSASAIAHSITLIYLVELFDPIQLGQS